MIAKYQNTSENMDNYENAILLKNPNFHIEVLHKILRN